MRNELDKRRERLEQEGTKDIMEKAQKRTKRHYENGFQEKIKYWTQMLNGAVENKDKDSIRRCKEKLDYFVGRQLEI